MQSVPGCSFTSLNISETGTPRGALAYPPLHFLEATAHDAIPEQVVPDEYAVSAC